MSALFAIAAPILAQEAESAGSSILGLLFPVLLIGGFVYIFLIVPRRRQRRAKELQTSVSVGDEIRTIGGIIGRIVSEDEDTFTIELEGSRMRITKRAVAERFNGDAE